MFRKSRTGETINYDQFLGIVDQVLDRHPEYRPYFAVPDNQVPRHGKMTAAYFRHSTEMQTSNHSLPGYIMTAAEMALQRDVVVPRSLLFYDTSSGEDMERPAILRLRHEWIETRRIAAVLVPEIRRLTRESMHLKIFERWCEFYGVEYVYGGGVPNGTDPQNKAIRSFMVEVGSMERISTNRRNLDGRIGRIEKGLPPTGKRPTGYGMVKDTDKAGRVVGGYWYVDGLLPDVAAPAPLETFSSRHELDRYFTHHSPAWVIGYIFYRIGMERSSGNQVATELNEMGLHEMLRADNSRGWSAAIISYMVRNTTYKGEGVYNTSRTVENPDRKLRDDMTLAKQRTIRRPKPVEQHVHFETPAIVSAAAWQLANDQLETNKVFKGRSKPQLDILMRRRVHCPECGRPMKVNADGARTYYMCYEAYRHEANIVPTCQHRYYYRCEYVHGQVIGFLKQAVTHPDAVVAYINNEYNKEQQMTALELQRDVLVQDLRELENRRNRIQRAWTMGVYDDNPEAGQAEMDAIKPLLAAARERVAQAESAIANTSRQARDMEDLYRLLIAFAQANLDDYAEALDLIERGDVRFVPHPGARDGAGQVCFLNALPNSWPGEDTATMKSSLTHSLHGDRDLLTLIRAVLLPTKLTFVASAA
jgi:DNA invertase Pin-like site-specific DNA recombinase